MVRMLLGLQGQVGPGEGEPLLELQAGWWGGKAAMQSPRETPCCRDCCRLAKSLAY